MAVCGSLHSMPIHSSFWTTDFFQRITIPEILQNSWFKKGYSPPKFIEEEDVTLEDIDAVFNNSSVGFIFPVIT